MPMADRILTTHSGSLPRPADFLPMVFAEEAGGPVDKAKLAEETSAAVAQVVAQQAEAGVDVLGDGEVGKPSYATYVRDRLTGFGGDGSFEAVVGAALGDLSAHADFLVKMAPAFQSIPTMTVTGCNGPVSYTGQDALRADIENLKAAVAGVDPAGVFMSSASPGVISVFSPNQYYASDEDYLAALGEAMREEYEAIHQAGFTLQVDCPDLAMIGGGFSSLEEFRRRIEMHVEVLNHALEKIPAEASRIHVCWGNMALPRTNDVELKDIIDIILKAKPAGLMVMASNGRHAHEWKAFRDTTLPGGKYVIPGVIDSTSNIVEHPQTVAQRLISYAEVVGRENVMAGSDCGFSTFAGMDIVVPSVVWAKLRSQAEGARLASEYLWHTAA
jgi:5-methyltetrahydropteroyltriglutamate--homocysteine methyltransferase